MISITIIDSLLLFTFALQGSADVYFLFSFLQTFVFQGKFEEEDFVRNKFDYDAPWQLSQSNEDAEQILWPGQWPALDHSSSELNHYQLNNNGHEYNCEEHWVFADSLEHVELTIL